MVLGCLYNNSFSQEYTPMFEIGKTWNYRVTNDVNHEYYFDMEVIGTTIINDKTYYHIVASPFNYCETYLREEIGEMKIYGIWQGEEYLHYDFSLEIGDYIWLLGNNQEITAIEYGSFYGMDDLRYYVLNDDFKLIEGVGIEDYGIADTFEYGCLNNPIFETLRLIGINGQLSSNTTQINPITIYPNPTTNLIYFNSNLPIEKVTITDTVGKIMTQIENPLDYLDMTQFPNGIYFLKMETRQGNTLQKVIKI